MSPSKNLQFQKCVFSHVVMGLQLEKCTNFNWLHSTSCSFFNPDSEALLLASPDEKNQPAYHLFKINMNMHTHTLHVQEIVESLSILNIGFYY